MGKRNQELKNTIKTLCFVLILGLALTIAGCSRKEPNEVQDIESVRANLREKVESDELTKEEAIVKLAEAEARLVKGDKDKDEYYKDKDEYSPALNA